MAPELHVAVAALVDGGDSAGLCRKGTLVIVYNNHSPTDYNENTFNSALRG